MAIEDGIDGDAFVDYVLNEARNGTVKIDLAFDDDEEEEL